MEAGVAIAALILLGAAAAALAAGRARRKARPPEVGDPYETLYPGRYERRAPLRRDGSGLRRRRGAAQPRQHR
jgi:hypothetical protein